MRTTNLKPKTRYIVEVMCHVVSDWMPPSPPTTLDRIAQIIDAQACKRVGAVECARIVAHTLELKPMLIVIDSDTAA